MDEQTGSRSSSRSTGPPAGGRLPDARLAERGRRRRAGGLAAAEPADADEIENLGGWLTTVVARVSLNMLRSRRSRPRGAARRAAARADRRPRRRDRSRARGAARRLGRPGAARRARDAVAARAARVRAARHVRRAVRRDRADRRSLAGRGASARQPRPPPRAGRAPDPDADLETQREVVDAFLAAARDGDFEGLLAVLDPDVVLRADLGPAGGSRVIRGAEAVAGQAQALRAAWPRSCGRRSSTARPAWSRLRGGRALLGRRTSRSGAGRSSRSTSSPTPSVSTGSI